MFERIEKMRRYREAVAIRGLGPILALALAETGTAVDEPAFRSWLSHRSKDVRAAGVLGLGRTVGASAIDVCEPMLCDPSNTVRTVAMRFARLFCGRAYARAPRIAERLARFHRPH